MVAACHASAPNMAKASRCSHLLFLNLLRPLHKHLACYMLLPYVTSDLLDLIIIDISSNNYYQHKEPLAVVARGRGADGIPRACRKTRRQPLRRLETAGKNQIRREASEQQQI